MRLDEQSSGKRHTHPPSSGHVLGRFRHHGLGETQTAQDGSGLGLECRWVHLLELLVDCFESKVINVIGDCHVLGELLESSDLFFGGSDNVIQGVDVGRVGSTTDKVDLVMSLKSQHEGNKLAHIDVFWNLDISLGDGLQEG